MNATDPKEFWESKILGWEKDRYDTTSQTRPLEKIASKFSSSLQHRLATAKLILSPKISNKRIIELGCGSARLAEDLVQAGAKSYLGIDIAENAIQSARKRIYDSVSQDKISLLVNDLSDLKNLEADVIFSLGLLDWLTLEQIDRLFSFFPDAHFLHSISERRMSVSQIFHRLYVQMSYGHRTDKYVPKYYSVSEIEKIVQKQSSFPLNVYRNHSLSFGAILTSLPTPE